MRESFSAPAALCFRRRRSATTTTTIAIVSRTGVVYTGGRLVARIGEFVNSDSTPFFVLAEFIRPRLEVYNQLLAHRDKHICIRHIAGLILEPLLVSWPRRMVAKAMLLEFRNRQSMFWDLVRSCAHEVLCFEGDVDTLVLHLRAAL